jgi:hypothetical protein
MLFRVLWSSKWRLVDLVRVQMSHCFLNVVSTNSVVVLFCISARTIYNRLCSDSQVEFMRLVVRMLRSSKWRFIDVVRVQMSHCFLNIVSTNPVVALCCISARTVYNRLCSDSQVEFMRLVVRMLRSSKRLFVDMVSRRLSHFFLNNNWTNPVVVLFSTSAHIVYNKLTSDSQATFMQAILQMLRLSKRRIVDMVSRLSHFFLLTTGLTQLWCCLLHQRIQYIIS